MKLISKTLIRSILESMKIKTLLITLIFSSVFAYAKSPLKVDEVKLVDVEASKASILQSLIEDAVINNSNFSLVSGAEAKGAAILSAKMSKLGASYLLIMTFSNGATHRSEKLKMNDFDEVDTAVSRIVTALLDQKSLQETAARGEVLSRDHKSNERVKSGRGFEIGLGTAIPTTAALGTKEAMWALGLGFAWDVNQAFMEVRWDILSHFGDAPGSFNAFTLGGNYLWHDDGRTAYFSGANFGFANSSNSSFGSKSGFQLGLDTGILFFRQADVNLDLRFRYMILAAQIKGSVPQAAVLMLGLHL